MIEQKDPINPTYYNGDECMKAMEAATRGKSGAEAICVGQVIKYLWRYESKNGLVDVKKSLWNLKRLISTLEEKEPKSIQEEFRKYPLSKEECVLTDKIEDEQENPSFPLEGQIAIGKVDEKKYYILSVYTDRVEEPLVNYCLLENRNGKTIPIFQDTRSYFKQFWSLWKQEDS